MMRYLYFILLIALFPNLSFGQSSYFSTDSITIVGVELIDGGELMNSRICQVKQGDKIIEYSPYEVDEFGFIDGRVYKSIEIQIADTSKRVFLERLHRGETTLYYYRGRGVKTFFIEKDSTLFVEVQKKNSLKESYSEQLLIITDDCSNVADACNHVRYNKKSLNKLIKRYNQCELKPFPHFRYGLVFGYESLRLIPSDKQYDDLEYFDFNYDGSFTIGFFVDNPIYMSDFSLYTELKFAKHAYSINKLIDNRDFDFVANLSSLKIPLLIRYVYPSNNIRPFFNIGLVGSYNIRNETMLYETLITESVIEISNSKELIQIDSFQAGYSIGGGIEYKPNFKYSVFFEIRFNNQYPVSINGSLTTFEYNFMTGIRF